VALITGGDSGIGRATAILFAREGAKLAILYLEEDRDARDTQALIEAEGSEALLIRGDVGQKQFCEQAVQQTIDRFGGLDILVNNAAEQHVQEDVIDIPEEQLEKTFRTNIFGYFFMAQAALKHMKEGASIINTTSVTSYRGNPKLVDYSSTKGAITAFTRALSPSWPRKGSALTGWRRGRSGRRSSRPHSSRKMCEVRHQRPLAAPASPTRSLPPFCFWPARTVLFHRSGAPSQWRENSRGLILWAD
jgi:NAD(P)-dependent dehydrogenase (short-subunit alcohol dehydrogenase family)